MDKFIAEFFSNVWPTETPISRYDLDEALFKSLSFEKQGKLIESVERILSKMKDIHKSGLEDEIKKTEEKLRKLKEL